MKTIQLSVLAFLKLTVVFAYVASTMAIGFRQGAIPGMLFTGILAVLSSILICIQILRRDRSVVSTAFSLVVLLVVGAFIATSERAVPHRMQSIAAADREARRFFANLRPDDYPTLEFQYVNPEKQGFKGMGTIEVSGTLDSHESIENVIESLKQSTTLWVKNCIVIAD
ncbi:MAG: hypothetical protein KDB03_01580 [Planctomycetales bacterium]|nr:hypothetical protein [Planctomycetales bacterium]